MAGAGEEKAGRRPERAKRWWQPDWLGSAVFGTLIALLGVFTGFIGSIFTGELKASVQAIAPWSAAFGVVIFIVCGLVTAVAVFARQRFIDDKREAAQEQFDSAAASVQESIATLRSLPDPFFLDDFNHIFVIHFRQVQRLKSGTIDDRLEGANLALQALAQLAQEFDGTSDSRFCANLMIFLEGEGAKKWINQKMQFYEGDRDALDGVLALPRDLAATATSRDDRVPEFCLPVPRERGAPKQGNEGGWKTLPGAPTAYCNNRFEHYATTALLDKWCGEFGDFTQSVRSKLRDHFRKHEKEIAGFMCIPIHYPQDDSESASRVLGIVNVHWDRCGRVGISQAADLFAKATRPLQNILAQLVADILTEKLPEPGTPISGRTSIPSPTTPVPPQN